MAGKPSSEATGVARQPQQVSRTVNHRPGDGTHGLPGRAGVLIAWSPQHWAYASARFSRQSGIKARRCTAGQPAYVLLSEPVTCCTGLLACLRARLLLLR